MFAVNSTVSRQHTRENGIVVVSAAGNGRSINNTIRSGPTFITARRGWGFGQGNLIRDKVSSVLLTGLIYAKMDIPMELHNTLTTTSRHRPYRNF